MGYLDRATCTVYLIFAPDQPGRKEICHYIREAKNLLSMYLYSVPDRDDPYIKCHYDPFHPNCQGCLPNIRNSAPLSASAFATLSTTDPPHSHTYYSVLKFRWQFLFLCKHMPSHAFINKRTDFVSCFLSLS